MKRFNFEDFVDLYNKKYKSSKTIFICLCVVFVLTFVTGLLISNFHNQITIMWIFSPILSLISIFLVSFLVFGVIEYKTKLKQLFFLLDSYLNEVKGEIKEIKTTLTSSFGLKGIEIILYNKNKDREVSVFYSPIFGEIPFKVGQQLKVNTAQGFIVEYEVKND